MHSATPLQCRDSAGNPQTLGQAAAEVVLVVPDVDVVAVVVVVVVVGVVIPLFSTTTHASEQNHRQTKPWCLCGMGR